MNINKPSQTSRSWYPIIVGILGLSAVIIIHELGHFIVCKLFGVGTPVFSIGFGPQLFSVKLFDTVFQIAALPLGGYVEIAPDSFATQPLLHKIIILLAGVLFNVMFSCALFLYLATRRQNNNELVHDSLRKNLTHHTASARSLFGSGFNKKEANQLTGPIGIIDMIQKSFTFGIDFFLFVLAILSLNIAFFNILPIPFFDGGKIAYITFEALVGPLPESMLNSITQIFLYGMIMLLIFITVKDILRLQRR